MARFLATSLVALVISQANGNAPAQAPTATKVASYTYSQISVFMSMAYASYGKHELAASIKYGIDVYKVDYSPGVIAGTPGNAGIAMAGLLLVPSNLDGELETVAFLHGTTMSADGMPSEAFTDSQYPKSGHGDYAVYGAMASASMGYAAIVPDGMGLASGDSPYPYVIAEGYAISTFNLHAAAKQMLPGLGSGKQTLGGSLLSAGYSEGGYGSLAVHQQSYNATWAGAGVTMAASYPAAGPYDLGYTQLQASFANANTYTAPSYFAYVSFAYSSYLQVQNVFKSDEIKNTVESWFDGTMSRTEIDSAMDSLVGEDRLALFSDTVISAVQSGAANPFVDALKANTLSRGWALQDDSKVHLCHGKSDTIVYPSNADAVVAGLSGQGSVTSDVISASDCTDHADCAPDCLQVVLESLHSRKSSTLEAWLSSDQGKAVMGVGAIAGVLALGFVVRKKFCSGSDRYEMIA